jgi:hypothetical protein
VSLEIRTRDNAVTGWARIDPHDATSPIAGVAQITWIIEPGRWHIDFLRAEQPAHLLPMLAAFRALWKARGRPTLTFRTTDDNRQMQRLARTLRARRAGSIYTVDALPELPPEAPVRGHNEGRKPWANPPKPR